MPTTIAPGTARFRGRWQLEASGGRPKDRLRTIFDVRNPRKVGYRPIIERETRATASSLDDDDETRDGIGGDRSAAQLQFRTDSIGTCSLFGRSPIQGDCAGGDVGVHRVATSRGIPTGLSSRQTEEASPPLPDVDDPRRSRRFVTPSGVRGHTALSPPFSRERRW
jgi:hypothetical protein